MPIGPLVTRLRPRPRHLHRRGGQLGLALLVAVAACAEPDDAGPDGPAVGEGASSGSLGSGRSDREGAPRDLRRPPEPPSSWAYTCPDGLRFTVHFREGAQGAPAEARLDLPEQGLVLPSVPAASGARYESADALFWDRGSVAALEVGAARLDGCAGEPAASPEDAARLLGFEFRGIGQEPGWLVDVDPDRQIRWVGDYGETRFATGVPESVERTDSSLVWLGRTPEHRIRVRVLASSCRDAMSGRPFSHTVQVVADGATYEGCGRWLDAAPETARR